MILYELQNLDQTIMKDIKEHLGRITVARSPFTQRQGSASCPAVLQLSWKALDSWNRNQDHVPWLDPLYGKCETSSP